MQQKIPLLHKITKEKLLKLKEYIILGDYFDAIHYNDNLLYYKEPIIEQKMMQLNHLYHLHKQLPHLQEIFCYGSTRGRIFILETF